MFIIFFPFFFILSFIKTSTKQKFKKINTVPVLDFHFNPTRTYTFCVYQTFEFLLKMIELYAV